MGAVADAALTAVIVMTPTAVYVGLWRLLMTMRDDDLIDRLDRRMDSLGGPGNSGMAAAAGMSALEPSDLDPELDDRIARELRRRGRTSQCIHCRTLNGPHEEACHACGAELPDEDGDGRGVLRPLGRLGR